MVSIIFNILKKERICDTDSMWPAKTGPHRTFADSWPTAHRESTDKLLQLIKLIQGCQKQKEELEKKKQKQIDNRIN